MAICGSHERSEHPRAVANQKSRIKNRISHIAYPPVLSPQQRFNTDAAARLHRLRFAPHRFSQISFAAASGSLPAAPKIPLIRRTLRAAPPSAVNHERSEHPSAVVNQKSRIAYPPLKNLRQLHARRGDHERSEHPHAAANQKSRIAYRISHIPQPSPHSKGLTQMPLRGYTDYASLRTDFHRLASLLPPAVCPQHQRFH